MSVFDKVRKNLEDRGYTVKEFATAKEAGLYLDSELDGASVGFGGSASVDASGAYELLKKHNDVYWHWKEGDPNLMRQKAAVSDVYLSSANALAESGEMVNIDGTGNRVSAMLYGHKKVYYIVGKNKLTPDLASAVDRARNYAAPKRAKQLGSKAPCTVDGKCHDCKSPGRICRGMTILFNPMKGMPAEVLLVDEELGL